MKRWLNRRTRKDVNTRVLCSKSVYFFVQNFITNKLCEFILNVQIHHRVTFCKIIECASHSHQQLIWVVLANARIPVYSNNVQTQIQIAMNKQLQVLLRKYTNQAWWYSGKSHKRCWKYVTPKFSHSKSVTEVLCKRSTSSERSTSSLQRVTLCFVKFDKSDQFICRPFDCLRLAQTHYSDLSTSHQTVRARFRLLDYSRWPIISWGFWIHHDNHVSHLEVSSSGEPAFPSADLSEVFFPLSGPELFHEILHATPSLP